MPPVSPAAATSSSPDHCRRLLGGRLALWPLALGFGATIFLFAAFPRVDLQLSRLLYDPATASFPLRDNALLVFVYRATRGLALVLAVGLLTGAALGAGRRFPWFRARRRCFLYLVTAYALGPGLLVNGLLKPHWHRPRPVQVEDFGGREVFEPPLVPGPAATPGYSFVSGHAAVGFFLMTFGLVSTSPTWLYVGLAAGLGIGAVRLLQGGHFLSDVLFAGWVVFLTSVLLSRAFFGTQDQRP